MKKIILTLLILLSPIITQAGTLSPASLPINSSPQIVQLFCNDSGNYIGVFGSLSGSLGSVACSYLDTINNEVQYNIDFYTPETVYFIEANNDVSGSIDDWRNDTGFIQEYIFTFDVYNLSQMTNFATSTFLATAGFAFSDLTDWSSQMTKLIIGTGIGVFSHLWGWILAIIIISTILALAYRAFRFFKH